MKCVVVGTHDFVAAVVLQQRYRRAMIPCLEDPTTAEDKATAAEQPASRKISTILACQATTPSNQCIRRRLDLVHRPVVMALVQRPTQ